MKIRGYLALGIICVAFPFFDLFQRMVVALYVWARPSRRIPVLAWWINRMRAFILDCFVRVGGAHVSAPGRMVPSGPGTLVIMNHQSLLDIPLVVGTVQGGYPRIVTRARYLRFIPLISHMIRLYQYPIVDPKAKAKRVLDSLDSLSRAALDSDVPIAIFPEGTRTRDGGIGRFKTRGLIALLSQRSWTVHVFVIDGYWQIAKFKDLVRGMDHIDGHAAYLGTLEWSDPSADPAPFIDRVRGAMVDGLHALRSGGEAEGLLQAGDRSPTADG